MEPYVPQALPPPDLDLARIIRKVGPANAALARYDGLLQSVINPSVLLSPLTNREAVLSSKIEGTQATVDEVLEYEAGIGFEGEKAQDIQEIVNYRKTLVLASEALAEQPLSLPLLRQMHEVLMDSVRGHDKTPGAFRVDQNWIGAPGTAPSRQATFVPPSPLQLLDHLQAWEAYLSAEDFDVLGSDCRCSRSVRTHSPVQGWQRPHRPLVDPAVPVPETGVGEPHVLHERVSGGTSGHLLLLPP